MLKYRLMTAIVLLAILAAIAWLLPLPFFAAAISVFFIIGAWEWARLIGMTSPLWRGVYVALVCILMFVAYFTPPAPWLDSALILWLWAMVVVGTYQCEGGLVGFQKPWVKFYCGLVMLVACWKGLVLLEAVSPWWLILCLSICWWTDTGAYFAGRRWGAHTLALRISPKKTWEGFWGGMILSVIVLSIASFLVAFTPGQRWSFIGLIIICTVFAVIGDLFVSVLKRQAGLKDSGALLPGHGGLLDRVDSTISVVPIFALGVLLQSPLLFK